jgi:hypothetical protein
MKRGNNYIFLMLMAIFLLVYCSKENELSQQFSDYEDYVGRVTFDGLVSFTSEVIEDEIDLTMNENISDDVLRGKAFVYEGNQERVVLYWYTDPDVMILDRYSISDDGCTITRNSGNEQYESTNYSWIATPHFYLHKNMIIQYIGDDIETIKFLESISDGRIINLE